MWLIAILALCTWSFRTQTLSVRNSAVRNSSAHINEELVPIIKQSSTAVQMTLMAIKTCGIFARQNPFGKMADCA